MSHRGTRRLAFALFVCALALAVFAAGSTARHRKKKKVPVAATLTYSTGDFSGNLTSPRSVCIENRSVSLWSFGSSASYAPTLVMTTNSDASGHFVFHDPTASDGFYGLRINRGQSTGRFICSPGVTAAIHF